MNPGIIGKKIGMSRVFTDDGRSVPVTILHVEPNRITQLKTMGKDGYDAVQVTIGERRVNRVSAGLKGHYRKAESEPGRGLWELRLQGPFDEAAAEAHQVGKALTVSGFEAGQKVDVRGVSIGKGFAGVMKRHGFGGGRATHGNSKAHRKPGSIGQNQDPGRVFPGKKMAGHMGDATRTQQNLEIVRVDEEKNLMLIKGSIPGPKGHDVVVKPSVKGSPSSD